MARSQVQVKVTEQYQIVVLSKNVLIVDWSDKLTNSG